MKTPKKPPATSFSDFPEIDFPDDQEATRPLGLHELPLQYRIDHEMATVRAQHPRVANLIDVFWGQKECTEYLKQLVLDGGDGAGHARIGFKQDVLSALINLSSLHEKKKP